MVKTEHEAIRKALADGPAPGYCKPEAIAALLADRDRLAAEVERLMGAVYFWQIAAKEAKAAKHTVSWVEPKWISVDECMPKRNRRVLAYFPKESTSVMDGIWDGERFMVNGFDRTAVVTHWHELPAPPAAMAEGKED